jgi:hypothetical protein
MPQAGLHGVRGRIRIERGEETARRPDDRLMHRSILLARKNPGSGALQVIHPVDELELRQPLGVLTGIGWIRRAFHALALRAPWIRPDAVIRPSRENPDTPH